MAAAEKKKGVDLALIFGGPKKPMKKDEEEPDMEKGEGDEDAVPPDFEAAATEAFPELADDPGRLKAFKRAIHACVDSYGGGEG